MDPLELDRADTRRRRQRVVALALVLAASATFAASAATLALFTDSADANPAWTSGTVVLGASPTTVFNASGLMPGAAGSQTVTVTNTGSGRLRYAMTSTATNADGRGLRDQVALTIRTGSCAAPGAMLYGGALNGATLGAPAQGNDTGDRLVDAGATDDLCFSWVFAAASGPVLQNAATSATFTFAAEQTANNP